MCAGLDGGPGDIDGDGYVAANDCDDGDTTLWSAPGETVNLRVPAGDRHRFAWDASADLGGASVVPRYEMLRSEVPSNFLSDASVACVDVGGTDLESVDPTIPAPGRVFFYLVRARNACAAGRLGTTSGGVERAGRDCDGALLCDDGNACTEDRAVEGTCVHDPIPPRFVHVPAATATCPGGRGIFAVEAAGAGTLHYAWTKNGLPVGVDAPILDLPSVGSADDGASITVEVTDGCSSAISDPVALTVFSDAASCSGGLDGEAAANRATCPMKVKEGNRLSFSKKDYRVALHSGELLVDATDLEIAGRGFDFAWRRTYRSREWRSTAMGVGWTHAYDRRIAPDAANPGHLLVHAGDSRIDSFAPAASGCYEAPGFFETLCPEATGAHRLTFPDGTTWTFSPFDGSPAEGRIVEARDTYGNAMTFAYDTAGRLTTITDTLGRAIAIAYNPRGLVASVTDFTGRAVSYTYYDGIEPGGDLDDLETVSSPPVTGTSTGNDFPSGKTTSYTYSRGFALGGMNHNLTSITDGEGRGLVTIAYKLMDSTSDPSFDRVSRIERPDGATAFAYVSETPSAANGFAVSKTVVKDPEGNVGEYLYDAAARLVREREYTGRATDLLGFTGSVDNRPTGPLRTTDPPVYESSVEYNADSLPTRVVEPNGNEVLWTYDSANPGARKRGDLLHETILPGPLGGDQTQIDRSWVHGTSFGTDWGGRSDSGLHGRNPKPTPVMALDSGRIGSSGDPFEEHADAVADRPAPRFAGVVATAKISSLKADLGSLLWPRPMAPPMPNVPSPLVRVYLVKTPRQVVSSSAGHAGSRAPAWWDDDDDGDLIPTLDEDPVSAIGHKRARKSDAWSFGAVDFGGKVKAGLTNVIAGFGEVEYGLMRGVCHAIRGARCDLATFPTSVTDGEGNIWTLAYDASGGLTGVTAPTVTTGTPGGMPQTIQYAWAYNPQGQLTQSTDPVGRIDAFEYHTSGPQTGYLRRAIVDQPGLALATEYAYDALGRVTRVTDPNGHATDYEYDALDNLVRATESAPFSYETDLYYDASDRLMRADAENVDETGAVRPNHHLSTGYDYDALGRLARVRGEIGGSQCAADGYEWTPNGRVYVYQGGQQASGSLKASRVRYDERGLIFTVTDGDGGPDAATTQYDYDGNGNLVAQRQGLEDASFGPNVTAWEYDGYDRLVRATDAEGNEVTLHYDANADATSSRLDGELVDGVSGPNVRLAEATYQYDEVGRLVRTDSAHFDVASGAPIGDGASTSTTYHDAASRVVREEDDHGHGTDIAYDSAGRAHLATDAMGNTTAATYDAASNITHISGTEISDLGGPPQNFTTVYEYDALDRRTAATDSAGNRSESDYDSLDRLVRARDQLGNVARYEYDGLGRLVRSERDLTDTGAGGGTVVSTEVVTLAWDDASRLVAATDPNGNTATATYDARDRAIAIVLADGTVSASQWDVHGNRVQVTDPNGSVQTCLYDRRGRLRSRSVVRAPGVQGTTSESYAYDGASRRVRAQDDDSLATFGYDSLSNPTSESRTYGAGPVRTVTSTYDGAGKRTSVTDSSGRTVAMIRDALDRVKMVLDGAAGVASYDYSGPVRIARVTRANGTTTEYAFDGLRRVVGQTDTGPGGPLIQQTFGWNAASSPTLHTNPSFGVSREYQYDSLSRLAGSTRTGSAVPPETVGYQLDLAGNRVTVSGGAEAGPYTMSSTLPEPADFQVNQYTTTPRGSRTYDRSGNTLVLDGSSPSQRMVAYDYRGQVCSVSGSSGSTTYAYDALGTRGLRGGSSGTPLEWVSGPAGELEQLAGGAPQWSFTYGADDALLRMDERADVNGNGALDSYFLHRDHAGSVIAASDATGALVERYVYDDFGRPLFFSATGAPMPSTAIGNPFLFAGLRYDAPAGLYGGSGDFDPQAGRPLTTRAGSGSTPVATPSLALAVGVCPGPGLGSFPGSQGNGPLGKTVWVEQGGELWRCYCSDYPPGRCLKSENWDCLKITSLDILDPLRL